MPNARNWRALFLEVIAKFTKEGLRPLSHRSFPAARGGAALRHLAQAKQIGKVVVSLTDSAGIALTPERPRFQVHAEATYLITGGLGGFGLVAAEWLVRHGARRLVLVGRSGASSPAAQAALRSFAAQGVDVVARQCDVTDREQLRKVIDLVDEGMPPLRGVVHAAMVLDDVPLYKLNDERMDRVIAPKALGAWNLHVLTANCNLDFFVMFSSFTSVVGNAGQANYVAGNAFLDALAWHRRVRGLPALTVNWGGVSDAGYLAQNPEVAERLQQVGLKSLPAAHMLRVLEDLLSCGAAQVGVAEIDWQRMCQLFGARLPARFRELAGTDGETSGSNEVAETRAILDAAPGERQSLLQAFLRTHLAKVLGTSAAKVDVEQPLPSLGLDSLMAMEMRNRIHVALGIDIPPAKFLEGASISGLAAFVAERLAVSHPGPREKPLGDAADGSARPPSSATLLQNLDQLSDEEVDLQLRARTTEAGAV